MANHVTFTNAKFDTVRGFYVEDARDIVFDRVQINAALGDPIVTNDASVMWNGKPASSKGAAEPFYAGN